MSKTAFIFPGQGSQYVGMGRALYEAHDEVRRLYNFASRITGLDIRALSFEGPKEELDNDIPAQLCMLVCNEAHAIAARKTGFKPHALTGYSMGFYSALVYAGCLSFEDALTAVKRAGELALQKSGGDGAMAAVIGLSLAEVERLCEAASSDVGDGGVYVSNINAARQMLISGNKASVARAVALAEEAGSLSAYMLDMGAAYHSSMMTAATDEFRDYLNGTKFGTPSVPVLSYIDAEYLKDEAEIMDTVAMQLKSKVLWKESVLRLIADGVDRFIEVGPGSALTRMVRWVDRRVSAVPMETLLNGVLENGRA